VMHVVPHWTYVHPYWHNYFLQILECITKKVLPHAFLQCWKTQKIWMLESHLTICVQLIYGQILFWEMVEQVPWTYIQKFACNSGVLILQWTYVNLTVHREVDCRKRLMHWWHVEICWNDRKQNYINFS
jgi:hypothetical protein